VNGEHLNWRAWWVIAAIYGVLTVVGLVLVTDQRLGLAIVYPVSMSWLAITRQSDHALRWFPLFYIMGGVLGLSSLSGDYSPLGHVAFAITALIWTAFLSFATVWIVRRLDRR
jgi:hypothetical protein